MRLYDLTQDAKKDLQEIVRYTHKSWGRAQVENNLATTIAATFVTRLNHFYKIKLKSNNHLIYNILNTLQLHWQSP